MPGGAYLYIDDDSFDLFEKNRVQFPDFKAITHISGDLRIAIVHSETKRHKPVVHAIELPIKKNHVLSIFSDLSIPHFGSTTKSLLATKVSKEIGALQEWQIPKSDKTFLSRYSAYKSGQKPSFKDLEWMLNPEKLKIGLSSISPDKIASNIASLCIVYKSTCGLFDLDKTLKMWPNWMAYMMIDNFTYFEAISEVKSDIIISYLTTECQVASDLLNVERSRELNAISTCGILLHAPVNKKSLAMLRKVIDGHPEVALSFANKLLLRNPLLITRDKSLMILFIDLFINHSSPSTFIGYLNLYTKKERRSDIEPFLDLITQRHPSATLPVMRINKAQHLSNLIH